MKRAHEERNEGEEDSRIYDSVRGWKPLKEGQININCDVAFSKESKEAGIEIIVRDSRGSMVEGCCRRVEASTAFMAEVLAAREAARIAMNKGFNNFILDFDCLELVKGLRGEAEFGEWRSKEVVEDTVMLLSELRAAGMCWTHRRGNLAADWLAKAVVRRGCTVGWEFNPHPPC